MLAVRIALVFRGCEDFSWILIDSKCNTLQIHFFMRTIWSSLEASSQTLQSITLVASAIVLGGKLNRR